MNASEHIADSLDTLTNDPEYGARGFGDLSKIVVDGHALREVLRMLADAAELALENYKGASDMDRSTIGRLERFTKLIQAASFEVRS